MSRHAPCSTAVLRSDEENLDTKAYALRDMEDHSSKICC